MKNKLTFAIATLLVFLGSCTSSKNVPYLIDAETLPQEALNSISPAICLKSQSQASTSMPSDRSTNQATSLKSQKVPTP